MKASLRAFAPLLASVSAVAISLAVAGLILVLGGFDPGAAFGALWNGAFGSVDTFVSVTLVRATPLLLTGLAVALAFRAGVWNIGAEGQFYAGAVAAAATGLALDGQPAVVLMPTVLASSLAAGAGWAMIPAVMKVRLGVGEVITTILLNFVAIELSSWLVHGPLQESRGVFPQTDTLPEAAWLPLLGPATRLHSGFLVAVGLALLLWGFLRWTTAGFGIRAVGASPTAARISGRLPVARILVAVFLASGALAGLAGGVEVTGVTHFMLDGLSPGHGYTAIAVALLAGLHPLGVLVTGVLFGALEGGAAAMQREAGVPLAWVSGVQALVIVSVLAAERGIRHLAESRADD